MQPQYTTPKPPYGGYVSPALQPGATPNYGQARRPNPFAQAQYAKPYEPEPPRPQPTYETPFRPAPQQPQYPYQPMTTDPASNPYQANPQLPEAYVPPQPQRPEPDHSVLAEDPTGGHSRRFMIVLTLVIILMASIAGALAYLYFTQQKSDSPKKVATTQPAPKKEVKKPATQPKPQPKPEPKPEPKPAPKPAPQPVTLALSSFSSAVFNTPSSVPSGYTPFDYKTSGVSAYVTDGRTCELQYGILGADVLPGSDSLDIVKRQVQALRDKGGTLSDPAPMADLKLAHPSDPNKTTYSLPSFSFTGVVKNGLHVRSHYAVAILKDGSRAYVLRTCNNPNNDVSGATLDPLESFAASLTIRPSN